MLTVETRKEELASIYSDLYKSVYGFRPRHVNTEQMTEAELEAELDALELEGKVVFDQQKTDQAAAVVLAEKRIADTIASGAKDRVDALRWIHQAEDTNGDDEFLCYTLGIPYGYFK